MKQRQTHTQLFDFTPSSPTLNLCLHGPSYLITTETSLMCDSCWKQLRQNRQRLLSVSSAFPLWALIFVSGGFSVFKRLTFTSSWLWELEEQAWARLHWFQYPYSWWWCTSCRGGCLFSQIKTKISVQCASSKSNNNLACRECFLSSPAKLCRT